MAQQCTVCGHENPDQAQLCSPCTGALTRQLRDMPELADDLETTMSRQDQLAGPNDGARSTETPLSWKDTAAVTLRELRTGLRDWAAHFTGADWQHTDHTIPDLSRTLVNLIPDIRLADQAPAFANAMRAATAKARRVIDKPPERVYLGPCGMEDGTDALCNEELFARKDSDTATCHACGAEHSTDHRRGLLLDRVEDQNVPATTVAGVLVTHMGVTVTTSMIRGYETRGRLVSRGVDRAGRKLFRVGDVMNVVAGKGDDHGFNVSA